VIKLLLKPIFKLTDIFLLVVNNISCILFALLKFRDNWFALNHLFKVNRDYMNFFF